MSLKPATKLLWIFLLDHCDHAGVVEPNFPLASFQIGETVNEQNVSELGDRLQAMENGKLWIPKFIRFQYGTLNPKSPVHASVIKLLNLHSIAYSTPTLHIPCVKGRNTPKDKDKTKDKAKDKETEKLAELIYEAYPLKVAKPDALKAIRNQLTIHKFEFLLEKTKSYSEIRNGNTSYVPYPSSWFNQQRFNDNPETWKPNENNGKSGQQRVDRSIGTANEGIAHQYKGLGNVVVT